MTLYFEGQSYNIIDMDGKPHLINAPDNIPDSEQTRNVSAGNVCCIILAKVKLEKGHHAV